MDETVKRQTGEQKTARNPVKIIPIAPLKKPDWIRVRSPGSQKFYEVKQANQTLSVFNSIGQSLAKLRIAK